ncbi:hypothetical protein EP331_02625 [bacterium]|nr:MAG: hypothetical protein EP331_02625 [bacterium]
MNYPIFDSIVKNIEADLLKRSIKIDTFRTWNEPNINATGLEMGFKLDDISKTIRSISINMDWDKFREAKMARELKGMEAHPYAKEKIGNLQSVKPTVDVEVMWNLDEKRVLTLSGESAAFKRLELASTWMENINSRANFLLQNDDIMTRWHVELEGDVNGRFVSNMCLISYFQYTLSSCHTILDVHDYIQEKLKQILNVTRRLMYLSEDALAIVA